MNLAVCTSPRFVEHTPPPGHAEQPDRAAVMEALAGRWVEAGARAIAPDPAPRPVLELVHDSAYLDALAATAGHARMLDPDTFTSPESWEIACLAAGAAVAAARAVFDGDVTRAAALVRPPGHHALAGRAMGFCLLNNIAIAAADALQHGVRRVAIVDFDVHHGNGTQAAFEADDRVLFVSLHQWPLYPGTGRHDEIGRGPGLGRTVNLPLPAGCVDEDYRYAFDEVVLPVLREHRPDLVLVSAGFDAHHDDPLARMRLTQAGFAALTARLAAVADECCLGRLAIVTEGGYDLRAFGACLHAVLGALAGETPAPAPGDQPLADPDVSREVRAVVARVRAIQRPFWRGL